MRKYLAGFILLMIIFPFSINGQSKKPSHAMLLQKALETNTRYKMFDSNTVIVDTSGYFKNCKVSFQGKQLKITDQWESCFVISRRDQQELTQKYRNYIVCTVIDKGKVVKLWFYRPLNNATLLIELDIKGSEITSKDLQEGDF